MIEHLAETGSTSADLAARLGAGERVEEGFWLRADRQSAGRGRQSRDWASPEGNLYASTVVHLRAADPAPATLAMVAALAAHDLAAPLVAGPEPVLIKWPNDLMLGGAKLAGILLERRGEAVIVGIGVNLASAPEIAERPAVALASVSAALPSPAAACATLADRFAERLARWREEGLAATLAEWQERAHPPGTHLAVYPGTPDRIEGTFAGIGPDGGLKLVLASGETRLIHAGDVMLA